ncbi:hypothetical protein [Actinocrispum wychmicini]|uniref:Uncharacterized protein n=1 Tax=Actinocrispum wychmicini TaxID=1213861 RepID=A0A4R2J7K1_9PSEU|nr:hypothetical protein [Actinocrispum wychmicini]TCO55091.1 hypothetical protein EV192_108379 [Actinocrispum wychmicini]
MRFVISAQPAITRFTEQLARAGVLLEAHGGTWLVEVSSSEEAARWAAMAPFDDAQVAR